MVFAQRLPPEGLICFGLGGFALGLLIAAVVLLAAVWAYNKLAGGAGAPEAVPDLGFGKALGISFVTFLVNFGMNFLFGLVAETIAAHPLAIQAVSMSANFLAASVLLAAMLPTTFGKGAVISLLNVAIVLPFVIAFIIFILGSLPFAR